MSAPAGARERLLVLYAFNLEVARAPWVTNEELIAEMRLQWWLDAIEGIYAGKLAAHEVVAPLAEVIEQGNLPKQMFLDLINARRFDIFRDGHADREAFDRYIDATSGNLVQLAALSLGASKGSLPLVADFGYAVGVANLFRALPRLYGFGRHPVPVKCTLDRNAVAGGEVPDNLSESLVKIATDASAKLANSRSNREVLDRSATPAMLVGWQSEIPLNLVARQPKQTLRRSMETSEFRKKVSLLWRNTTGRW